MQVANFQLVEQEQLGQNPQYLNVLPEQQIYIVNPSPSFSVVNQEGNYATLINLPGGSVLGSALPASGNTGLLPRKSKYRGVAWDKRDGRWRVRINCLGVQHHVGRYSEEHQAARIYDKVSYLLYGKDAITNFGVAAAAADHIPIPPAMLQLKARYDSVCTKQHKAGPVPATSMQFANLGTAWNGSSTSGSNISSMSMNSGMGGSFATNSSTATNVSNSAASSYGPVSVTHNSSSSAMVMVEVDKPLGAAHGQQQQQLTEVLLQPGDLAALRHEVQLTHATPSAPQAAELHWQHQNARLVPVTTGFFIARTSSALNLDTATMGATLHQVTGMPANHPNRNLEQRTSGEWQPVYGTVVAAPGNGVVSMPMPCAATAEMLDANAAAAQQLTAQFSAMGLSMEQGSSMQAGRDRCSSMEGRQVGAPVPMGPKGTAEGALPCAQVLVDQQRFASSSSSSSDIEQALLGASPGAGGTVDGGGMQPAACGADTDVSSNVKAIFDYCMVKLTRQELLALASQLSNTLLR